MQAFFLCPRPSTDEALPFVANVDEPYIDLCRQMLRREDNHEEFRDDPLSQRADDLAAKRRRRKRRKDKCAIL
jgi:hypothetical protein